ncbi:uncharacterized protein LOC125943128 [Dermacentor silvarum]|uniref:uncharacterized protein LOC125943128 n=1 Tax=Dermacentor silvarum TaxID=543639 RepID=UPI002101B17C|nr:uncharacterized protein LOC125943128 [Dermacentor silvarum]
MRPTFAAILLVSLVAFTANAYAFPEEEARVDTTFDSAAQDAVYLGEVLRDVAQTLAEDEELGAESDEYFFRALWNKTKEAVKGATNKVKVSVKGAYKEAKDHIKKAAKEAQQKLKDKAAEIISKLLTKVMDGYALEDSESSANFIKVFVNVIQRAAQKFMKMGKVLQHLEN